MFVVKDFYSSVGNIYLEWIIRVHQEPGKHKPKIIIMKLKKEFLKKTFKSSISVPFSLKFYFSQGTG